MSCSSSLWVHLGGVASLCWYSILLLPIAYCSLSAPSLLPSPPYAHLSTPLHHAWVAHPMLWSAWLEFHSGLIWIEIMNPLIMYMKKSEVVTQVQSATSTWVLPKFHPPRPSVMCFSCELLTSNNMISCAV